MFTGIRCLLSMFGKFSTRVDGEEPSVVRTLPASGAVDVPRDSDLMVVFAEAMDSQSLLSDGFELLDDEGQSVVVSLSYDGLSQRLAITPDALLLPLTTYTARVLMTAADEAGNTLAQDYEWTFTTGALASSKPRLLGSYRDEPGDMNGLGLYRQLSLWVDVEVETLGTYNLNGRLVDGNGRLLAWQTTGDLVLSAGIHSLPLQFKGSYIRNHGQNGPYTLDAVHFYDVNDPNIFTYEEYVYQTAAYNALDFYSLLTFGGIPDQLVEVNTTVDNAFNLADYTAHDKLPLDDVAYGLVVNSNPSITVTIDDNDYVDIAPAPDYEGESEVWVEAHDAFGNRVLAIFFVWVERARPSQLDVSYAQQMDLQASQLIEMTIRDQWERLFTEVVTVTAVASEGNLTPGSLTTDSGMATFTYTSGEIRGVAEITIMAGDAFTTFPIIVGTYLLYLPLLPQ